MSRQQIINDEHAVVGWFDEKTARRWDEDTYWDGNNHISCATKSQWYHERLYLSRGGRWIINHFGGYSGVDTYQQCSAAYAATWLLANDEADNVPPEIAAIIEKMEL
jgi:hypothetical protein